MDDPIFEGDRRQSFFTTLDKLESETFGLNLKVRVLNNEKCVDEPLSDGTRFARGLVLVADNKASVVFIAINDQIEQLEVGQNYILRNAKVIMFKGWMRLEVDDWGKIEQTNEEIIPNTKKNMSLIEYELVDSEDGEGE